MSTDNKWARSRFTLQFILRARQTTWAAQVELSRSDGNIWSLMFKGDLAAVRRILENDPSQASPEWNLLCSLRQECVQHYLCCALAVFI